MFSTFSLWIFANKALFTSKDSGAGLDDRVDYLWLLCKRTVIASETCFLRHNVMNC